MEEDRIENLMRQAEVAGGMPKVGEDLAGRVFRAVGRRRKARVMGRVAAVMVLLVGVGWMGWRYRGGASESKRVVQQTVDVRKLQAQLAESRCEADWRMKLAMGMWERERQADKRRHLVWLSSGRGAKQPVEYAACSMVYQADRMHRELRLIEPAAEIYRQVSEDFPNTPWAAVARQRLAELQERKAG